MKNTFDPFDTVAKFPKGYGEFPYIIIRVGYAIYMQVPIHFNVENGDTENFPGTHINHVSQELIDLYAKDKSSALHEIMIDHCKKIKQKMERDGNKPVRMCLVETENSAHYFEGEEILANISIPFGGTLVTQKHGIIGIGMAHYIKPNQL